MSVGVIIVAAGRGARLGASQPKQVLDIGGRTMLQRAVAAFDTHPRVHEIVVVLPADLVQAGESLTGPASWPCVCVAGGARRQDSVRAGFSRLSAEVELVLIHDAARPFVDAAVIDRVIDAAREAGAAVPAVEARDTVKHVAAGEERVRTTIPRHEVRLAQTPQGFRRGVLADAMAAAAGSDVTDEAMLVEQSGGTVRVVPGDARNVKITTAADLAAARMEGPQAPRVGTGYDLHRLVQGRPLVLAGVIVPFEFGPLGHSDGDVVCHALTDAVLGAACAGDIGQHFSNTDPRWNNAAGLDLLARAVAIVR
jgi:2-C-methyl-D-erythritol 4-phosphate cytidylyltransferase/2-C-methyl-D-erythritol 2,4-cyclodiphosphate synthase